MKFLTGSYNHTVDGKNRIRIPSKLKYDMFPELKNESDGASVKKSDEKEEGKYTLYFRVGTGGCISAYTEQAMNDKLAKIGILNESDEAKYLAASVFASLFKPVESDPQGRFVLPPELRVPAGIDEKEHKDIVICGNFDHIDIWQVQRYNERIGSRSFDINSVTKILGI